MLKTPESSGSTCAPADLLMGQKRCRDNECVAFVNGCEVGNVTNVLAVTQLQVRFFSLCLCLCLSETCFLLSTSAVVLS